MGNVFFASVNYGLICLTQPTIIIMIVNVYASSLLKHINTNIIQSALPNISLTNKTSYTLKEKDAYKHDQGKALETVVIPDVKRSRAEIVCLENGVNEATKISRSGLKPMAMQAMLRNTAAKLVDFAKEVIENTNCKTVVLIKMMPRYDYNIFDQDVKQFLQNAHYVWNDTIE